MREIFIDNKQYIPIVGKIFWTSIYVMLSSQACLQVSWSQIYTAKWAEAGNIGRTALAGVKRGGQKCCHGSISSSTVQVGRRRCTSSKTQAPKGGQW